MSAIRALTVVCIPLLLCTMSFAPASLAEESAAPDSARVSAITADDAADESEAVPGATWGALLAPAAARAATAEEEKKKRVKKPETRRKNDGGRAANTEDDDDDDDDDCMGSCMAGLFASLFSSSDPPEQSAATHQAPPAAAAPAPAQVTPAPAPPPEPPLVPAPFSLALDVSWWRSGPSAVWDEYKDGGGRFAVTAFFVPAETFEVGIDIGVAGARGYPLYDYEGSTSYESPQISHLWMVDGGVRAGMVMTTSHGGPILRFGVGPRVFWVKEHATLEVYELPGMDYLGERKESLEAWRLGGDAIFSMLWDTKSAALVGFTARFFIVPWDSEYTRSLTLDHIGRRSLAGFNIGLTVHFNGF